MFFLKEEFHSSWFLMVVAFSSLARILGKGLTSHSSSAFKKKKMEISSRISMHFFLGQDDSTVAQHAEMTVAECFQMSELRVNSFL